MILRLWHATRQYAPPPPPRCPTPFPSIDSRGTTSRQLDTPSNTPKRSTTLSGGSLPLNHTSGSPLNTARPVTCTTQNYEPGPSLSLAAHLLLSAGTAFLQVKTRRTIQSRLWLGERGKTINMCGSGCALSKFDILEVSFVVEAMKRCTHCFLL